MPEIGEIKRGREVGFPNQRSAFLYHACVDCGKGRWMRLTKGKPVSLRCVTCANIKRGFLFRGSNSPKWKGGRRITSGSYVLVWISPTDFFYPMADSNGYVLEHRLVVAKALGRCLQEWEWVHHKGIRYTDIRNKLDNLEDNLEMTTSGSHMRDHSRGYRDGFKKGLADGRLKQITELQIRVTLLEAEIIILKQEPIISVRAK